MGFPVVVVVWSTLAVTSGALTEESGATAGHAAKQSAEHDEWLRLSAVSRYTVRPDWFTKTFPSAVLATLSDSGPEVGLLEDEDPEP
jgi:hypothetical protein